MKNRFFKTALLLSAFMLIVGCNTDDHTGNSTLTPSNPSLSVALDFANTQTLIEQEQSFSFTVTISEAQIVNTVIYLTQTGGTATAGDDFDFPASLTITAGSTSVSGTIDILSDELVEDTETAVIQIATGLESNVQAINSQTVTFNIANLVEGDLMVDLFWEPSTITTDNSGETIEPTDLADLRLLVTNVPYTTIIDEADGAGFESLTLSSTSPDGEYYIVADFFGAMNIDRNLNLIVDFNQVGVTNDLELSFPNALNTLFVCPTAYFILAKVIKTGTNYEIVNVGEKAQIAAPFVGTATVVNDDWADYSVGASIEIEAGSNAYQFYIRSYSNPAIANPNDAYLIVDIDPCTYEVNVNSNILFDYGCNDGTISGTGTVDPNTLTIDLVLQFALGSNCGGNYTNQGLTLQL